MVVATGIEDAGNSRLGGQPVGEPGGAGAWRSTLSDNVSSPLSMTQALNGLIDGPVWR
jgi:hypothetical protein